MYDFAMISQFNPCWKNKAFTMEKKHSRPSSRWEISKCRLQVHYQTSQRGTPAMEHFDWQHEPDNGWVKVNTGRKELPIFHLRKCCGDAWFDPK
jgi:hypothetical protein